MKISIGPYVRVAPGKCPACLIGSTQKKQEVQRCKKGCCLFIIFLSETTGPIGTKLGRNGHWMVLWKVCVFLLLIRRTWQKQEAKRCQKGCYLFLIFFSETIGPIETKNYSLVVPLKYFCCWLELHKRNKRSKGVKGCCLVLIFLSETTGPVGTKLGWNIH